MDHTTDQLFILDGVTKLSPSGSNPFECQLSGDTAFPLVKTTQNKVIVAAATHGRGKMFVVGDAGFVSLEDFKVLIGNGFKWLFAGKGRRVGMWVSGYDALRQQLVDSGFQVIDHVPGDTATVDVIFTDKTVMSGEESGYVDNFVRNGGGLLISASDSSGSSNILPGCGISLVDRVSEENSQYGICEPEPAVSLSFILNGVSKQIDFRNVKPSKLHLYGKNTFSIVEWENGAGTGVAASHVGVGRSMHWGNSNLLKKCIDEGTETLTLAQNSFKWLARNKEGAKFGFLQSINNRLKEVLTDMGVTFNVIDIDDDFGDYDVISADSNDEYTEEQLDKIHRFLSNGGGLLTDGNNWSKKKAHASNIVKPSGMIISEDTAQSKSFITSGQETQPFRNVSLALKHFIRHAKGEVEMDEPKQREYRDFIYKTLGDLPSTCSDAFNLAKEYLTLTPVVIPTKESPIDVINQPLAASYAFIYSKLSFVLPASELQQLKLTSEVFPGDVPSNLKTTSKTMVINGTFNGLLDVFPSYKADVMRSTGLYAAPGKMITVTIPIEVTGSGLEVRIGCHTDSLHEKDELYRFPKISRSYALDSVKTQAANVFGGLVYIKVPYKTKLGSITVTIDDAFESPQFISGTTTVEEWKESLERFNVPFCELISKNFIISLPTVNALDHYKDAVQIMDIYERIVCSCAELSGIAIDRPREERIVLDIQISKGKMHSGYPIMGPISNSNKMMSLERVTKDNIWGPIHELGHQHQSKGWNPSGTTEATCNIYSVYASEKVLQIPRDQAHSALQQEKRKERIEEYITSGRKYENWNVWTCLETYLQLQEAFGWQFIIDMLAQYNSPNFDTPKSNTDQLDLWMVLSSKLAGLNLGPFYQSWGWEVTERALASVEHLPPWEKNPMAVAS